MAHKATKENRKYRFHCTDNKNTSLKSCTVVLLVLSTALASCAEPVKYNYMEQTKAELEKLDPFMGDWQGSWRLDDGTDSGPLAAHVIALGDGKYRAKLLEQFDVRLPAIAELESGLEEKRVRFTGPGSYQGTEFTLQAVLEDDEFAGTFQGQDFSGSFSMEKVIRLSPTLGARPPKEAVILFDDKNFKNFKEWKRSGNQTGPVPWKIVDGAMEVVPGTSSIMTIKEFADVKLHLEFRTPFMPKERGQARGNSGVYLQGRYEVQVLDSYGLEGRNNECGGIYGATQPIVNMCAPPMQWQTYDITFHAARFDSSGKKAKEATMTVLHNGVKIHDKVELTRTVMTNPDSDLIQRGGVYLQNHGNRVQYRNIWVVELPLEGSSS